MGPLLLIGFLFLLLLLWLVYNLIVFLIEIWYITLPVILLILAVKFILSRRKSPYFTYYSSYESEDSSENNSDSSWNSRWSNSSKYDDTKSENAYSEQDSQNDDWGGTYCVCGQKFYKNRRHRCKANTHYYYDSDGYRFYDNYNGAYNDTKNDYNYWNESDYLYGHEYNSARDALLSILDLDSDATHKQIKKRYKQYILKYHPDKNHSHGAQEKTVDINNAWDEYMRVL